MKSPEKFIEQHETPEEFPSLEQIEFTIKWFLRHEKVKAYKELLPKVNEKGVYFFEVEATMENGEVWIYNYQKATNNYRDPSLPASGRFSASIHVMYCADKDGIPYDTDTLTDYLDGEYEYPTLDNESDDKPNP